MFTPTRETDRQTLTHSQTHTRASSLSLSIFRCLHSPFSIHSSRTHARTRTPPTSTTPSLTHKHTHRGRETASLTKRASF